MPIAWIRTVAIGTFLLRTEPKQTLSRQRKALLEMSRYGRVGIPGTMLGWEDVDAVRFQELHQELIELVNAEGGLRTSIENA